MSKVTQIIMYFTAIFIFFFIGCLFTEKRDNYVFAETFAKGGAIACVVLFVLNYHINMPIKKVYWVLLILALLGLVVFVCKIIKFKKISLYQLFIFSLLIFGGV